MPAEAAPRGRVPLGVAPPGREPAGVVVLPGTAGLGAVLPGTVLLGAAAPPGRVLVAAAPRGTVVPAAVRPGTPLPAVLPGTARPQVLGRARPEAPGSRAVPGTALPGAVSPGAGPLNGGPRSVSVTAEVLPGIADRTAWGAGSHRAADPDRKRARPGPADPDRKGARPGPADSARGRTRPGSAEAPGKNRSEETRRRPGAAERVDRGRPGAGRRMGRPAGGRRTGRAEDGRPADRRHPDAVRLPDSECRCPVRLPDAVRFPERECRRAAGRPNRPFRLARSNPRSGNPRRFVPRIPVRGSNRPIPPVATLMAGPKAALNREKTPRAAAGEGTAAPRLCPLRGFGAEGYSFLIHHGCSRYRAQSVIGRRDLCDVPESPGSSALAFLA